MKKTYLNASAIIAVVIISLSFSGQSSEGNIPDETSFYQNSPNDSMPRICEVITGADITGLSPFTNPLTETEAVEEMDTHSACLYKFYKPNDYPAIKISFSALTSAEVKIIYTTGIESHRNTWERDPERIINLGDSANFSYNADADLCDVCGLTVISDRYLIVINLKGQYEDVNRETKKEAAIKISRLLFERITQLKTNSK